VDPGPVRGTEQAGRRPYLVLSQGLFNDSLGACICVALTSRKPKFPPPLAVPLASAGLPKRSWVKVGQVRTISVDRLGDCLGRADRGEVDRVVEALLELVGNR